jgi:hypothetical protein
MAALLSTGAAAVLLAAPATAVEKKFPAVPCQASVGGQNLTQNVDITVNIEPPTEANAGQEFVVTFPGGSSTLPNSALNGAVEIFGYKNLSTSYKIAGATWVDGSVTTNGDATINGAVTPGSATISGDTITFATATAGQIPPGTLVSPTRTVKVLAGAAGSTVSFTGGQVLTTAVVGTPGNPASGQDSAVTCNVPAEVLATTAVVTPPAPGAPNAVNDNANTPAGQAVTINVLANDTANATLAIDPASLKINSGPASGTAVINADRTITYTPNAGFTGTDSFVYELCSVASTDAANPSGCDTATVTITVAAAAAAQTTPTTAAPTAAAALPRTGGSSMPLAIGAFVLIVAGLAFALQSKTAVRRP